MDVMTDHIELCCKKRFGKSFKFSIIHKRFAESNTILDEMNISDINMKEFFQKISASNLHNSILENSFDCIYKRDV